MEFSAKDDPSDAGGGAGAFTHVQHETRARANRQAAPRLLSPPIQHRIRICRHCGIGQATAHKGPDCQHCRKPLALTARPS